MTTSDVLWLVAALVFVVVFCRWTLHVMNTPRKTPKVPRDLRQRGRWVWGAGWGPFWWWFG